VEIRSRSVTIVAGLLLSCSLVLGGWAQQDPGILGGVYSGVYFLPGQTQVGYACGTALDTASHMPKGAIIMTTDGGTTWTQQNPNTMSSMLLAIYFSTADTGYACGVGGAIVRTTDGGASWTAQTVGFGQLNYVRFPSNGRTGYIGVDSDTFAARVLKTTDGGDNWSAVSVGGSQDHSTSCAMATDSTGIVFGPDAFVYGVPGGYQDPQAPGCIMIAADYSPTDKNKAYLVGNDTALGLGIVRYTTTGGNPKWDSVRCPAVQSLSCVDYPNPETAFVGGADGFIGGSHNAHDFAATNTGVTNQIYGISFPHGPDTGYAAAGPIILKTTDSGQPWGVGVAERKSPAAARPGIRVVSNPSRRGISYYADAEAQVTVFDANGSIVAKQNAPKGVNFLPLSKAGVYMLKATAGGFTTTRKFVVER
jgi:photosystem II stability/assembly factor-like uncharacterized protein